jgi:hypothetical protein
MFANGQLAHGSPSVEALVQAAIFLQRHCGYSWARLGEPELDSQSDGEADAN